jgi:hypothetical protein
MLANLDFSVGPESVAALRARCSSLNFFIKSCIYQICIFRSQNGHTSIQTITLAGRWIQRICGLVLPIMALGPPLITSDTKGRLTFQDSIPSFGRRKFMSATKALKRWEGSSSETRVDEVVNCDTGDNSEVSDMAIMLDPPTEQVTRI